MTYPNWIPLNSEKTTSFICEWDSCQIKPTEYITFGCLEQHLGELTLCGHHRGVWAKTVPAMLCDCGEPIDGYMNLMIRHIHPTWLTPLLRNQHARRARKYLSGVRVPTSVNTNVVKPTISPAALTPNGPIRVGPWMKRAL